MTLPKTTLYSKSFFKSALYLAFSLVEGLHCGEQQHVPDGGGVGQQHHQAVHTEAQAARGGQAILQRGDVVVVHLGLGVGIQSQTVGNLLFKPGLLIDRDFPLSKLFMASKSSNIFVSMDFIKTSSILDLLISSSLL